MAQDIVIGGKLHSAATGNTVAGANEILDDAKGKKQNVINQEVDNEIGSDSAAGTIKGRIKSLETAVGSGGSVDERISEAAATVKSEVTGDAASDYNTLGKVEDKIKAEVSRAESAEEALDAAKANKATTLKGYGITDAYTKSETYNKTEVNGLVDTPHQNYVTVLTYAALIAINPGSTDTIYRVSNYDGSVPQVDVTKYSEYAWDGTQYVFLCVKSQIDEVFDISVYNNNATYADLAAALGTDGANVPQTLRRGGMSIKFVSSVDNKYVQYRLMNQNWSINTEDWAISDEGVYVENSEFVYVKTDAEGKILWAIKADGSIYYGAGVPQQVIDYIEEKIADLSLDEYEDIVAFLNDLEKGDKTLQTLLDEKVDKEEGKSLINKDYADGVTYIENPEFVEVKLDNEGRIISGVRVDGTTVISKLEAPELDKLAYAMQQEDFYNVSRRHANSEEAIHYDAANGWEQVAYNQSASNYDPNNTYHAGEVCNVSGDNKHSYKSLTTQVGNYPAFEHHYLKIVEFMNLNAALSTIPTDIYNNFAAGQIICFVNTENIVEYWKMQNDGSWDAEPNFTIDNPEYLSVELDKEKKILGYTAKDGSHYLHNVKSETIDTLSENISALDSEIHNNPVLKAFDFVEDHEGRLQISTDSEGRIVSYRKPDGTLVENVGIELSDGGLSSLAKGLRVNWSDYISNDGENPLHLSMPKCARINLLTKFNLLELSKKGYSIYSKEGLNYDIPIEVEFWDMQGNYFKKKAFIGGQGDSTMAFDKKNIAIDLFDSEWDGDAFSIKFGDWVAQDSFHLKAYDYEPFVGVGTWSYKLFDQMASIYDPESDRIWKKALWDTTDNIPTQASGSDLEESSEYNDTGAKCFPDGFPVVIYQNDAFWGVFAFQMKKHRDNYHLSGSKPNHVFLDGKIGEGTLDVNGDPDLLNWGLWEVRNPKNLVYAPFAVYDSETTYKEGDSVTDSSRSRIYRSLQDGNTGNPLTFPYWKDCGDYTYKYDADITQAEIAGNHNGSSSYSSWSAGSYAIGDMREHNGHIFMNTVADNTAEPIYHSKNNSDSSPDFKNKTGCGWLNITNTVKVKENIFAFTTIMTKIDAKETAYLANPTAENLAAMKAEFETYFDVQNLIDYIIVTDVIRDDDAFWKNWLWTTYDGVKWWCNLYDCNISFGYGGAGTGGYYRSPAPYMWNGEQCHLCTYMSLQPEGHSDFMLRYIIDYYADELNQTWIELREGKIIDENNIYNIAKNWIDAVGLDAYALENAKWGYAKHIDNMVRIKKWIYQSVLGLDQLYDYFGNLYADCTIYRSTERDYTIRCIDMKVSHNLSKNLHYIHGYITRHESTVGGVTVSTYSITGGEETEQDMTKTYVRVKDAITAASSQPVDVPSETLSYIEARCENIEYHRK